jgi:hypothetical protein
MAPSVTPIRTGIRIHGRCRIYARWRINRIFINDHWRRCYDDRPPNHHGLGKNGSRFLHDDRRRGPGLVCFQLMAGNFAIARDRQIGSHCRRGQN